MDINILSMATIRITGIKDNTTLDMGILSGVTIRTTSNCNGKRTTIEK
jgi:hypothetical protein